MRNGIIKLDSDRGKELGFTSDRFSGYLWKVDGAVMISLIRSLQRGNFRALVTAIHAKGWAVKVPTPMGRMVDIIRKNGYVHSLEHQGFMGGSVNVWTLAPQLKVKGL